MSVSLLPPGGWPEDERTAVEATPAAYDAGGPPLIELAGLRLRAGRRAVDGELDLTVRHGEMVLLAGQPRSGRSALLSVLGLLDRPAAGRYLLDGTDTGKLSDRDRSALRARQIGFVFQRKLLLPTRSVLDNVMLPLRYSGTRRAHRRRAALESLDQVGLSAAAQLMTWELSADELALCAIARALVNKAGLLLCDEPTAGLDQDTAARIIGLLAGLHREGRTLVIAAADQLAAAYSSRSVRIGPAAPAPAVTPAMPPSTTIAGSPARSLP